MHFRNEKDERSRLFWEFVEKTSAEVGEWDGAKKRANYEVVAPGACERIEGRALANEVSWPKATIVLSTR